MDIISIIIAGLVGLITGLGIALLYIKPLLSKKMALKMIPKDDYNDLHHKHSEQKTAIFQLKSLLKSTKIKVESLQKQVAEQEVQIEEMQPDYELIKAQKTTIEALTDEVETVKVNYVRAENQDNIVLDLKKKALDEAVKELEKKSIRIAELEGELTHKKATLDKVQNPPVTILSEEKEQETEAQKAGSENSKPQPATPKPALSKVISTQNSDDNLRAITGIGAIIQDKLNQEGIRSFQDLSDLDDKKIKEIQEKTKIFSSKLRTWSQEAKQILQKRTEV